MENRKTFYLGSGEFSSQVVKNIYNNFSYFSIICPKNNKLPAIKTAKELNLNIYTIEDKNELEDLLDKEKPEIIIVCDFGIIITEAILKKNSPIVNIHPSLLPKYRGCSPIISCILNGDKVTGVSLMKMEKGIDEGPVYLEEKIKVDKKEDVYTLTSKLSKLAGELVLGNISAICDDKVEALAQQEEHAIYTKLISKAQGLLNLKETAEAIERKIRAYKDWPGIFTYIVANGKEMLIKIIEADVIAREGSENVYIEKDTIEIKTAKDYLSIKRLKPEGKREMTTKEFLCGYNKIELKD